MGIVPKIKLLIHTYVLTCFFVAYKLMAIKLRRKKKGTDNLLTQLTIKLLHSSC